MATDPITPALTADEWKAMHFRMGRRCACTVYADSDGGQVTITANGQLGQTFDHGDEVQRPHALAALCLYQQPFGFTREMVTALRNAHPIAYSHEEMSLILDAADRIEALLPPEP